METVTAQDDSSEANPSSIKSEDGASPREEGRSSPPPKCAICLGTCRNKSFTDSCLHQFCFKCLVTWSKVKTECPLCKQVFKSIIHNVRSNHQYEEYPVEPPPQPHSQIEIRDLFTRRYRFRATLTMPRHESMAFQQFLMQYPLMRGPGERPRPRRNSPTSTSFRRTIYRHNLWARPLPDFTGRFRDCSPEFYRTNPSQVHRLVPWLNRELRYLLNDNASHIAYVVTRILDLLPQQHIKSHEFREALRPYFGARTVHFIHEFYCFTITPYDMTGYDRHVQYSTETRSATLVESLISGSDSESTVDSDIQMVSSSHPAETAAAGPSRVGATHTRASAPPPPVASVIPIETILHSDSEESMSEVVVVGYIKPPGQRTPEIVDLLNSEDSDVMLNEPEPEPASRATVKLTVTTRTEPPPDSDSDECLAPAARRRRRAAASPPRSRSSSSSSSSTSTCSFTTSESEERPRRKKPKRKPARPTKKTKKPKQRSPRTRRVDDKPKDSKSSKRKSRNGKDVKSSKKKSAKVETEPLPVATDQPGPSQVRVSKRKSSEETRREVGREAKRLRSVVNVMGRGRARAAASASASASDSEDDVPLNLTLQRLTHNTPD